MALYDADLKLGLMMLVKLLIQNLRTGVDFRLWSARLSKNIEISQGSSLGLYP